MDGQNLEGLRPAMLIAVVSYSVYVPLVVPRPPVKTRSQSSRSQLGWGEWREGSAFGGRSESVKNKQGLVTPKV